METQAEKDAVYENVIRLLTELAPTPLNVGEIQDLLEGDVSRKLIYWAADRGVSEGRLDIDEDSTPHRFSLHAEAEQGAAPVEEVFAETVPVAEAVSAAEPVTAEGVAEPVKVKAKAAPAPARGQGTRGHPTVTAKRLAAIASQRGQPKQPAGKMLQAYLEDNGTTLSAQELKEVLELNGSLDSVMKSLAILVDKGILKRKGAGRAASYTAVHPKKQAAAQPTAPAQLPLSEDEYPTIAQPSATPSRRQPASRTATLHVLDRPAAAPVMTAAPPAQPAYTPQSAPAAQPAYTPQAAPVEAPVQQPTARPVFGAQMDWDDQLHLQINGERCVLTPEETRKLARLIVGQLGRSFMEGLS